MLSPRRLAELIAALDAIPHVGGHPLPQPRAVVDPGRVTDDLVAALSRAAPRCGSACTSTTPRELTPATRAALARLVDAGVPVLSQSVLLRGVNDDAATLDQLMRALVRRASSPTTCTTPTWRAAPATSASRSRAGRR